jgi:hypothetical protein
VIVSENALVVRERVNPPSPSPSMSVPIVVRGGVLVDNGVSLGTDAFARVRMSEPTTLFQIMSTTAVSTVNAKQGYQICESVIGAGASSVQDEDGSCIDMGVSDPGDVVVRQSRLYIPYQPGKSKLVLMSAMLTSSPAGVEGAVSRVGVFDDYSAAQSRFGCGHYFELDGGDLYVVERNTRLGVTTETRIPRESWNGDRLDGSSGGSGFTLQLDRMQLFWMDFEWLGVGVVRFGVMFEGQYVTCHTLRHTNELLFTYIRTPKLPVRYEITAKTSIASPCTMKMVCATVISEGGYVPKGIPFSLPTSIRKVLGSELTPVLYIGLRDQGFACRSSLLPKTVDIVSESNQAIEVQVIHLFNQTALPAGLVFSDVNPAYSMARYSINTTTMPALTNATVIFQAVVLSKSFTSFEYIGGDQGLEGVPFLSSSFAGTTDLLLVAAKRLTAGTPTVDVSINWEEIQA